MGSELFLSHCLMPVSAVTLFLHATGVVTASTCGSGWQEDGDCDSGAGDIKYKALSPGMPA